MEMIRAGQQLSLRGVSGLKGSWLRVSSCDLENRKASTETETERKKTVFQDNPR
jgi:hypothetical protein